MMEVLRFSETLVLTKVTRCHITEDGVFREQIQFPKRCVNSGKCRDSKCGSV
jgi:hypothetical protein